MFLKLLSIQFMVFHYFLIHSLHYLHRFSWGLTALIQRFAGGGAKALTLRNSHENPQNSVIPTTPTDMVDGSLIRYTSSSPSFASFDDWSVLSRIALLGPPQGTMGGLLVAGFLFKTVGWRLLVISGK